MTIDEARRIVRGEDAIRHQQWLQRDPKLLAEVDSAYQREYPGTAQIEGDNDVGIFS
jgi:hypothetical protein